MLQIVQSLQPYEVQRQEYIRELVYTERTHVHKLKTMQYVGFRLSSLCTILTVFIFYTHTFLPRAAFVHINNACSTP